jgi:small-conductance mechanosensitive channel
MFGAVEIGLLSGALLLVGLGRWPRLKAYRSLLAGGGALLLITALFPRAGNPIGQYLFAETGKGLHLPREAFGVLWWVLGAWLAKSVLDLVLRRTIFPDNDEPHARRLFADLAAMLIYVLAFFGMLGSVFHQPASTFLATSGVLAIILGLALQNTLGDVLAGLAINIERPFGAGDWIAVGDQALGQVIQVNWRATHLRTWSNDMLVIPNSIVTKAVITNHSRPRGAHHCLLRVKVDIGVPPPGVIAMLTAAAKGSPELSHGTLPLAYACEFSESVVVYELAFAIDSYARTPTARSDMLLRVAEGFRGMGVRIGASATDIRIVAGGDATLGGVPAPAPGEPVRVA